MSGIVLKDIKSKSNNDTENVSEDTITILMDATESQETQKDINADVAHKSIEEMSHKDTGVRIGDDILKPYILNSNGRLFYRRDVWIQFMGPAPEPMGAPLDYTPESRNRFVLLVFSIVFFMLLCTAGFNLAAILIEPIGAVYKQFGYFIIIPPMIIMIGMSYAMACSRCTRVPPCNFICLVITVICMSIITAFFTTRYKTSTVLYAVLATTIVVIVCMCLACSSFDFTRYILFVVVISAAFGGIALIVMLGMLISGSYIQPLHLGLLIVGTLLQVIILTIDLQTILGGRSVELGEDDYALGAFMLYTSIIDIFIKMMQMIGMFE